MGKLSRYHTLRKQQQANVERWKASGLSQAEFCRREGIPEWALSNWKRRMEKELQRAKVRAERAKSTTFARVEFAARGSASAAGGGDTAGRDNSFVPVTLVSESRTGNGSNVVAEITFSGGVIKILSGADSDTLRELLRGLMECSAC